MIQRLRRKQRRHGSREYSERQYWRGKKDGCLPFFILLGTSKMSAAYLESIAELRASANTWRKRKIKWRF